MFRLLRGCLLTTVALVGAVDCSLLVEDELAELRCSQEGVIGAPACDPGRLCATGRCRVCIEFDICGDGIDNDCNGRVDDRCQSETATGGAGGESEGGKGGAAAEAGSRSDSN